MPPKKTSVRKGGAGWKDLPHDVLERMAQTEVQNMPTIGALNRSARAATTAMRTEVRESIQNACASGNWDMSAISRDMVHFSKKLRLTKVAQRAVGFGEDTSRTKATISFITDEVSEDELVTVVSLVIEAADHDEIFITSDLDSGEVAESSFPSGIVGAQKLFVKTILDDFVTNAMRDVLFGVKMVGGRPRARTARR